jgi:spore coat polysaccharide biosynthesis protein SpsF
MPDRIVAVIQARCGSARLPGKVLLPLAGQAVLAHVVHAVRSASLVDDVIVATTVSSVDDELVALARRLDVRLHRGPEQDVLQRFVDALAGDAADVVVRHVADAPLVDPAIIDTVVGHYLRGGCDYAASMLERSWPRGVESEVISRGALEQSARDGTRPEDREHVTVYVRSHPERFRLRNVRALPQETWPELRLTLDTDADYRLLQAVFGELHQPGGIIRIGRVIDWLRTRPELVALNAHIEQKPVLGHVL